MSADFVYVPLGVLRIEAKFQLHVDVRVSASRQADYRLPRQYKSVDTVSGAHWSVGRGPVMVDVWPGYVISSKT